MQVVSGLLEHAHEYAPLIRRGRRYLQQRRNTLDPPAQSVADDIARADVFVVVAHRLEIGFLKGCDLRSERFPGRVKVEELEHDTQRVDRTPVQLGQTFGQAFHELIPVEVVVIILVRICELIHLGLAILDRRASGAERFRRERLFSP